MLAQLLQDSVMSLRRPTVKTFQSIAHDNWHWSFVYLAIGGVLSALLNVISSYFEFHLEQQSLEPSQNYILELFVNNMHNPIFIFLVGIGNFLFVLLIWILLPYGLGRVLGGSKSSRKFVYTSALYITPMGVLYSLIGLFLIRLNPSLATIPFLAFAVFGNYLVFVNLQAVMNLPKEKAFLVLLIPVVIAAILFCCSLSIAVITNIFSS